MLTKKNVLSKIPKKPPHYHYNSFQSLHFHNGKRNRINPKNNNFNVKNIMLMSHHFPMNLHRPDTTLRKTCVLSSISELQMPQTIVGISKPFKSKFNLVGSLFNWRRQLDIFTSFRMNLFHLVEMLLSVRIKTSIPLLTSATEKLSVKPEFQTRLW